MFRATTLEDNVILELTATGKRQLMEPGTRLQHLQLEALVLIDGRVTVSHVAQHLRSGTNGQSHSVLRMLLDSGFVQVVSQAHENGFDPGSFFDSLTTINTSPEVSERDQKAAAIGSRFLQKHGYCVNMARTLPRRSSRAGTQKFTVLAIDDDPDVCNLLKLYLKLEGIEVRTASNRTEIIEQFKQRALPDLVLLDVVLPDVNGFDLLGRMRSHQALKGIPIIMLTAESSRGGVLRGITGGADGYVTKPFQIRPLVCAIKAGLGLEWPPQELMWDSL